MTIKQLHKLESQRREKARNVQLAIDALQVEYNRKPSRVIRDKLDELSEYRYRLLYGSINPVFFVRYKFKTPKQQKVRIGKREYVI